MKQKTIRLPGDYSVVVGQVMVLDGTSYLPTRYEVGTPVVLVSSDACSRDGISQYSLVFAPEDDGAESRQPVEPLHGRRVTANGGVCYAHGLREITSIRTLKNGQVAVTVGPDRWPDKP